MRQRSMAQSVAWSVIEYTVHSFTWRTPNDSPINSAKEGLPEGKHGATFSLTAAHLIQALGVGQHLANGLHPARVPRGAGRLLRRVRRGPGRAGGREAGRQAGREAGRQAPSAHLSLEWGWVRKKLGMRLASFPSAASNFWNMVIIPSGA